MSEVRSKTFPKARFRASGVTAALLALAGGAIVAPSTIAWAQKPAAKLTAPKKSAEQILSGFIQASGGEKAFDKLKTTVITGTVTMTAQKINGTLQMEFKAPNKIRASQTLTGIGEFTQGFDGTTAWSKDPLNGLRTLEGAEREQFKTSNDINPARQWRTLYKKMEVLGVRKVGTASAYAVRLTPKNGKTPVTQYFDTKTNLLVRMDMVAETPNGSMPTESYFSDYRTVSGVKLPFKTRQVAGGIAEILMTYTSVKANVPIEDSRFTKPKDAAPAAAPAAG